MYKSHLGSEDYKFWIGATFQYDEYNERLNFTTYDRTEMVPGVYFEYTYSYLEKFNAVAGVRADHHNHFGSFVTPRLHIRYAITEKTILRTSGGRGQRTANILSENSGLLASSRRVIILGDGGDRPYGLNPEVAWNYGLDLTQYFRVDHRKGSISFDYYRTDFENQAVMDLDQSPQEVYFYNLQGVSYSNSFQLQVDYEVIEKLNVRLAYRWYEVQTTYNGKLMQKPFVATHRSFLNIGYETNDHWKFDYTVNWQGEKRIPFTGSNQVEYQLPEKSPQFVLMNGHISKTWKEKFELYGGVENLLGYVQKDPILSSELPFSKYFDSSLIWGPIFGRNVYFGFRYKIK